MPDNPFSEEFFPNIQSKHPLVQLEAVFPHAIASHLGEETNTHLATASFRVVVDSDKVSPQPPLLQVKQPQFPQLLLIRLVLYTLHKLCCPSLDKLQHLNVLLVVRSPKLNTELEVQPHQCRVQGDDHSPSPAGHTMSDTSQDAVGFLGHLGTLLAHVQPAVDQHPQVAAEYFKNTTLLLMGVICVASSVEKWNLHKRIALRMVMMAGAKPGIECILSQAQILVLPPKPSELGLSTKYRYQTRHDHMVCKCLSLSISYAATIGGLTTIIGTSTSLIFLEHFNNFKETCSVSKKMKTKREEMSERRIQEEYKKLGNVSYPEMVTGFFFILMTLLWFTREPGFVPGWSSFFEKKGYRTDATVSVFLGFLLFLIPAKKPCFGKREKGDGEKSTDINTLDPIITWKDFQKTMPWEIVVLVGGGYALAAGCKSETLLINPLYTLIPVTMCISFAVMLPVGNPPNAIVFSYGHCQIKDMVKAGLGVNLIGLAVVMVAINTWGIRLFQLNTFPEWAAVGNVTSQT
ncbi:solute carrier family 13 member 4 [Grus japonensis]|uniref:Solute carrier family 13 member 4 n=1 Tax=Grus japonensis TaxID=30415 RepID=A0ABC9VWE2_GRUJA